jgi:SPP1 gp7 family putative phage head morphogenesis protein
MLIKVQKAAKRKPRRPPGNRTDSPEIRAAASILSRNETRFSRAFLKAMRALYASDEMKGLKKAISSGQTSIEAILDAMPWFNEADPESVVLWTRLMASVERAYIATIEDSGQYTARHYGFPMKFKVTKAELAVDIVVPINPHSIKWVNSKSLSLIKDISDGQRNKLRALLARNFERGVRPEAIIEEIEAVVGLTETQAGWVVARRDLAIARGIPEAQAKANAKDFAQQLLTRRAQTIARTETVDAHTKGLEDSWQLAKEGGFMPPGTEKVWQAMMDDRTSEICEELDGEAVPIDQPFVSNIVGDVMRPPAHPNCRSTMTLRFP